MERSEFGEKQQRESTTVKEEEQIVIDVDEEMSPSVPNATSNTSAVIPISSEGEMHSMSVDDQESEQTESPLPLVGTNTHALNTLKPSNPICLPLGYMKVNY